MESKFLNRLDHEPKPLVTDGAMGTLLHAHGISFEECFDFLNWSSRHWWQRSTMSTFKQALS